MNTSPSISKNEPQVHIERTFAFPRDIVFRAWTTEELLTRWFAPRGCTIEFRRLDIREGGGFHACLRNPTFGNCWTLAEFREVVPPERLVFDWYMSDETGKVISPAAAGQDPEWPQVTRVTVTFTDKAGGTLVTLAQTVSESLAKRTGAHPSWLQMLDVLGEMLGADKS